MINDTDDFLRNTLLTVKTIAIVGASDKETRPSYGVFSYLLARGYQVIGVNPSLAGKSVHEYRRSYRPRSSLLSAFHPRRQPAMNGNPE
jgi:predicted CoA-binding protein